jgi:hypothetical protein
LHESRCLMSAPQLSESEMTQRKTRGLRRGFFYDPTPPPGCAEKEIQSRHL